MRKRRGPAWCLVALILVLLAFCSYAQIGSKKKVTSQAHLLRLTSPVKGSASVRCKLIWIGKAGPREERVSITATDEGA
jgi:hypothetical protein